MKYEIGGRVKISNVWFNVIGVARGGQAPVVFTASDCKQAEVPATFIQDYEPPKPKPKPFDWLKDWHEGMKGDVNQYLTDTYGDPTERVYRGESAEAFGLNRSSYVNYWCNAESIWDKCVFNALTDGDLWRKMPNRITPIEK